MDFYSPLRYPGGKGKIANYFKRIFKDNLLYDGIYVEPYGGGCSVALALLYNEYASKVIINDLDRSIFAFWHSVLEETDELCKLIYDTPVTIENWEIQKQIQKNKEQHDLLDVGFSTFFVNRTNRSGIISAGVIGGRKQEGKWKLDARYNKSDLLARVQRVAGYKNRIELHNSDAVQLIKNLSPKLPKKTLFYFDPPYFVKGKDLYLNFYNTKDHKEIADEVGLINQKWIVTYDNVPTIRDLYKDFRQMDYRLSYSSSKPNKGEEIMIFSDNIYISEYPVI